MTNVTRLPLRSRLESPLRQPENIALLKHWAALREARGEATKKALRPRAIAAALPWTGLLESGGAKDAVLWRLAGSGLCRIWKRELTGSAVFAEWPRFERDTLTRMLVRLMDGGQPFTARVRFLLGGHGRNVDCECLALPLVENGRRLALFSLVPGVRGVELDLIRPARVELHALRALHPPRDAAAVTTTAPVSEARKGRLRLIPGGLSQA